MSITEDILKRIRSLEARLAELDTDEIETFDFAGLPTGAGAAANGAMVYISDGRKSDEGIGNGTGNLAMWREDTTEWVLFGLGAADTANDIELLLWAGWWH